MEDKNPFPGEVVVPLGGHSSVPDPSVAPKSQLIEPTPAHPAAVGVVPDAPIINNPQTNPEAAMPQVSTQVESHSSEPAEEMMQIGEITWESDESAFHERGSQWYLVAIIGAVLFSVIVYFLNKDFFVAGVTLFALVGLAFYSGRKSDKQHYSISHEGVYVGNRLYSFQDFRSFSVTEEQSSVTVVLIPLKKFMPAVSLYIPLELEDNIVNLISDILPMENRQSNIVDQIMRRFRS